eukprot:TRINITY_DN2987_c1_g2_i1.p1 TRINITY_DN2987_c1_g2~~TRINITY_DN2987_c1_g2_i1.p1  ORF type:complete len:352 (-),score=18.27 TRINITY_DN2987_c1_g2_i1:404-1459(-)
MSSQQTLRLLCFAKTLACRVGQNVRQQQGVVRAQQNNAIEVAQRWSKVHPTVVWVGIGAVSLSMFELKRAYSQEATKENAYSAPTKLHGMPKSFTLYQYQICPFCNKVRAFMDYHNIPYKIVEVNPVTKSELKWSNYKKVPVLLMDEEQVNDSNIIISRLNAEIQAVRKEPVTAQKSPGLFRKQVVHPAPVDNLLQEERQWREWVDTRFVRVLTANIYRTLEESWQTFSYITNSGNFSWYQRSGARYFGTGLMYYVGRNMPKKYNIKGDLRENLYKDANEFIKAVGERQFMGGMEPNLADLTMFGVIRAVTGTDTFNDLMKNSDILPWYERMRKVVGESSAVVEGWETSNA